MEPVATTCAMIRPRHSAGVLTVVLAYLVLAPIGAMLLTAFRVQFRDVTQVGQPVGEFTLYYLERVFASRVSSLLFWTPLVNTIMVSVLVTAAISLIMGILTAWLIVRYRHALTPLAGFRDDHPVCPALVDFRPGLAVHF
jgi:ABC-type spermidine/putrescine transport system permease subunit II